MKRWLLTAATTDGNRVVIRLDAPDERECPRVLLRGGETGFWLDEESDDFMRRVNEQ